eukprot:CAMPEP_0168175344 /NCGR_PEP_ID=MMETSP0139_2-20121125/7065_1 /TAXON_ID=44445 /ORGANISM="Pseudo-nitzschia australis, Strain 10249 10 AB" /LENGTH=851 /DNA_ID=CAMNT_0008093711 /DNA_START=161 /DNA_END=2714 /DNA_ORIENTATION=-
MTTSMRSWKGWAAAASIFLIASAVLSSGEEIVVGNKNSHNLSSRRREAKYTGTSTTIIRTRSGGKRLRRKLRPGTECTLFLRLTEYDVDDESESSASVPVSSRSSSLPSPSSFPSGGDRKKRRSWVCEMQSMMDDDSNYYYDNDNNHENTGSLGRKTDMKQNEAPSYSSSFSTMTRILVDIEGLDDDYFDDRWAKSGFSVMIISEGYLEAESYHDNDGDDKNYENGNDEPINTSFGNEGNATSSYSSSNNNHIPTRIIIPPEAIVEVMDSTATVSVTTTIEDDDDDEIVAEAAAAFIEQDFQINDSGIFDHRQKGRLRPTGRRQRRLTKSTGTLLTLVIRVIGQNGIGPTASTETTRNNVFLDETCLKSQYAACSMDQLIIQPYQGNSTTGVAIDGGVVDVKLDIDTNLKRKYEFIKRAYIVAHEQLGNLEEQFDLVLFCIPPGTGDDWKAEAHMRRWDSYYNDKWCGFVSAQMHEVGHNLGLAHSGQGDPIVPVAEYRDKSGVMGISYQGDDGPKMCFNAAKNYQLEWYTRQRKEIDPTKTTASTVETPIFKERSFVMNGVVDYKVSGPTDGKIVALRLKQEGSKTDYYIGYNRATGANVQTQEDANRIVVLKKTIGGPDGTGKSWKLGSLRYQDQRYVIPNFGLESSFVEIRLRNNTVNNHDIDDSNKDIVISVTSFKGVDSCPGKPEDRVMFTLKGKTDNYGYETWWSLKVNTRSGGYVDFGSGYDQDQKFGTNKYLCRGQCYVFEMNDIYGDGICDGVECDIGAGYYKGYLGGEKLFSSSSFERRQRFKFCVAATSPPENTGHNKCKESKQLKFKNDQRKDCSWVARRRTKERCSRRWKGGKKLSKW